MVRVIQYPDLIIIKNSNEPIYNPETGEWDEPILKDLELKCRFIPNTNKSVRLQDGTEFVYSYVVAIPFNPNLNIEDDLEFIGHDKSGIEIARGRTKMFHIGQLHSKLWV